MNKIKKWIDLVLSDIIKLKIFKGKYMEEDQIKIDNKLKELNGGSLEGDWVEIKKTWAMTEVDLGKEPPLFIPTSGVPLKIFYNKKTAELKVYTPEIFKKQS